MVNDSEFENFVFEQALENAVNYSGKSNPKALIGKCVPKFPEMKEDMAHFMNEINNIVEQVNEMNLDEQREKLLEINPDFFKQKEQKKEDNKNQKSDGLPNLSDAENGVVVRMEPAPSGYMHLGHLFPIVANYETKRKYGGKFIVRIADTNPDNINIENYDKVIEDINWICENDIDEIFYQSDRLPLYYKYIRQIFEMEKAYVCECDGETFKAYTDAKEECPHAKMTQDLQEEMFEKFMKAEYNMGEAVLRFRTDITHKNPAMRSFSLARINTNKHARVGNKYKVWPTMHLAVAIDDIEMGMTHVIRGKDHEINMERQMLIHQVLGMKSPHYFHIGRMKFVDINLSKSDLTKKIEDRVYEGWDDPRVPSLVSYRKRGYKPEAFRKFILSLGISKRDSKITSEEYHKGLDYFNKQILETESDRFFFVHNPKKIHITNIDEYPEKEIQILKHPDHKERGYRHFELSGDYLIDSIDHDNIKVLDTIRLMHFANFKVTGKDENGLKVEFISKEYDKNLELKRNIHFVPFKENEKVIVVMQDNSRLKGVVEDLDNIKENANVQF